MSLLISEKSILSCLKNTLRAFGHREGHESVRKTKQKIILCVVGEKQGSFLGTGRAEMEAFAAERSEEK